MCFTFPLCLHRYWDVMDPIECAKVNSSHYCWVTGNAGEKGSEEVRFATDRQE